MTKAELSERVADLEGLLIEAQEKLEVLIALNGPYIARRDPGSPVCISFNSGNCGVLVYQEGATLFDDTETVAAVGHIPAGVLMDEIEYARRVG